jgi:chaperonin GroES
MATTTKAQPRAKQTIVRPAGSRLLVLPEDPIERTPGGIVLPENSREKPVRGRVRAVGLGKILETGERETIDFEVDDVVLYGRYAGTEVKVDEVAHLVIDAGEILATIE